MSGFVDLLKKFLICLVSLAAVDFRFSLRLSGFSDSASYGGQSSLLL